MKKVSIIIVNHNGEKYIRDCLDSVAKLNYENFEVIVVDTNSSDESPKIIQNHPVVGVRNFEPLQQNVGFSRANNLGVRKASGDYIALLNPDTLVDPDWLKHLVTTLHQDQQIGIAVSKIYLGKTKYLDSAGSEYNQIMNAWSRGVYELDEGQYDHEEDIPMATACAMLFRREILDETSLFDPDFFLYIEELDFCLRVRNLGYRIVYQPQSVVSHLKSQSVSDFNPTGLKDPSGYKQYHGNINRSKLLGKYLSFADHLRNFHVIFASFFYWNWYFFIRGRWWMLLRMMFFETVYFWKGLFERMRSPLLRKKQFQKYMKQMSLRDLISFKKELELRKEVYEQSLSK